MASGPPYRLAIKGARLMPSWHGAKRVVAARRPVDLADKLAAEDHQGEQSWPVRRTF